MAEKTAKKEKVKKPTFTNDQLAEKTAKKEKVKKPTFTNDQLDRVREQIRKKLNAHENGKLNTVAHKLGVDVKKYSKLGAGLQKMSIVNACVGSVIRKLKNGDIKLPEAASQVA